MWRQEHASTPASSPSVTSSSTPASPTAAVPNAILPEDTQPKNTKASSVTGALSNDDVNASPSANSLPFSVVYSRQDQSYSSTISATQAIPRNLVLTTPVATTQELSTISPALEIVKNHAVADTSQSISTVQPFSSSQLPRENGNVKSRAFDIISSGLADIVSKIPSTDTLPAPRAASHVPGSVSSFPEKERMNVASSISTRLAKATDSHELQHDPPRHVISVEEHSDNAAMNSGSSKPPATRCYCETVTEDLGSDAASSLSESTPPGHVAESVEPEVNRSTPASDDVTASLSKITPLEHAADSVEPEVNSSTPASDDSGKVTWSTVVTNQDTFTMTFPLRETSASGFTYAKPYGFDITTKKSYSGDQVMCNSSFCLNEADHLSAIFHRNLDPCEDFYAFACQGWLVTSSDQEKYEDVDDALSGTIEELAKGLLEASASGDDLRETLALFGLDITKVDAPSAEDVLVAASNLDEADVLLGRDEASESENVNKLTSLACKFIETLSAVAGEGSNSTDACAYVAHVAVEMAKMISRVAKSKGKWRNDTMLAVKNPAQIDVVKSLLSSKAESLFHYLGLHVTVYVSPFLEDGQSFMEASYFLLSGRTRSPPKWRLCVRLVDRILPSLLIVSFEQYMNRSDTFSELMLLQMLGLQELV
ncbi:uncharacterized protein LOC119440032 [Dermacentor silvarum]|uniref:uncharacterized protein LOC119440032 n=1 Tax=Dermacentor silvarum TaxID=543639 RepID=UPI002101C826|nr:uncharacterized protein LOC119440032 [Dermacentor silvarum]